MIPVYVLKTQTGEVYSTSVYLSNSSAKEALKHCLNDIKIDVCYLPYVNNSLYLVRLYSGYEGDENNDTFKSVYHDSEIYPCEELAKNSKFWTDALALAKSEPDNHRVHVNYISSDDSGHPFWYGTVSSGNFIVRLITLTVKK